MVNAVICRKIIESLKTLLPVMNEQEVADIARVIYLTADRLEKEEEPNT